MAKLVDIQGRFPCEPDNKKPTLIKKWEYSTNVINLRKKISNSFRIDIFFLFWYAYIIKRNHEPASKKDVIIYETFSKSYIHGYTKNKI